jgi:flagellar biosynthesis protein FlhB
MADILNVTSIRINEYWSSIFFVFFFSSLVLFASGGVCFYLMTTDFARLCLPMTTDLFRFATTKHMNLDGEVVDMCKMYSLLVFFFFLPVLFASGCFTEDYRTCLPMTTDMFRFATTKHMNLDGEV